MGWRSGQQGIRRVVFGLRLSFHRLISCEGGEKRTTAKNKRPKVHLLKKAPQHIENKQVTVDRPEKQA